MSDYQDVARKVATSVASRVMPFEQMPANLNSAYEDLTAQLLADEQQAFF